MPPFDIDTSERAIKSARFPSIPDAVTELERWASACDVDSCAAVIDDSGDGEVLLLFGTRAALLETPYGEHYREAFTSPPQRSGDLEVLAIGVENAGAMSLSVLRQGTDLVATEGG